MLEPVDTVQMIVQQQQQKLSVKLRVRRLGKSVCIILDQTAEPCVCPLR